jgi:hypothetical protein
MKTDFKIMYRLVWNPHLLVNIARNFVLGETRVSLATRFARKTFPEI